MKKQGFSSLYIVMILSSLLFFVLVVVEVTAGFATRSVAENLCVLTCESIASEYQKELWDRYGLLALNSFDEKLTSLGEFYIGESLASEGADILKMKLTSCQVSSEKYPALDIKGFAAQIKAVSVVMLANDLLSKADIAAVFKEIRETVDETEETKERAESQLESLSKKPDRDQECPVEEDEGEKQSRKQARSLLRRYKTVTENQTGLALESNSIDDINVRKSLPSYLLEIPQRGSILLACIALVPDLGSFVENEYILRKCSYATDMHEECYISLEAEYLLYGRFSDAENEKEIRSSLFWLRSALNIAHIYADPQKQAAVNALAAGAFSLVPLPVAAFIISGIWAAVEAQNDLMLLFEGECVPFFKTKSDWKCSLSGAVSGNIEQNVELEPSSKIGRYSDYLRLFLLAVPQNEKLARLMDVMQLNIANQDGYPFCFRDYAYGFSLTAHFEKAMHLPGNGLVSKRTGTVVQEYVYEE